LTRTTTKQDLLENAGYRYSFDRELYFNREAKKAFSVEFVEDHSEEEMKRRLDQMPGADWQFFFNSPPSDAVKRELASILG
jgi:hypothetical protein